MIQMMNNQVTPELQNQDNQKEKQDGLILAGSSVSWHDLYEEQMNLPLTHGDKYYQATDVDNLLITMNKVLGSVSEQAFRNDKALSDARAELQEVKNTASANDGIINSLNQRIQELNQANIGLQQTLANIETSTVDRSVVQNVEAVLKDKQDAYDRLLQSTSKDLSTYATAVSVLKENNKTLEGNTEKLTNANHDLTNENESLKQTIASLQNQLQEQQTENSNLANTLADSQKSSNSEEEVLQYKYDNLKKLSADRINELTEELQKLKGAE